MPGPRTSPRQKLLLVGLGLLLSVLALEGALRLGGALFLSAQESRNQSSLRREGSYRILCLGESTTALGGPHAYPRLLEEALNRSAAGARFSVINRGVPGTSTDRILRALPGQLDRYRPDLVVAMMGVNDTLLAAEKGEASGLTAWLGSLRSVALLKMLAERLLPAAPEPGSEPLQTLAELHGWLGTVTADELREELARDPGQREAYQRLAVYYVFREKRPLAAVEVLEDAVDAGLADAATFDLLRRCYRSLAQQALQDEHPGPALEVLREAERRGLLGESDWGWLAAVHQELGDEAAAEAYARRARDAEPSAYPARTRANYRRLHRILAERGIRLVAVQYPMRSVEALSQLLGRPEDVVFVDNEAVFRQALRQRRYASLFVDSFGGDFGHMTEAGHRLLAENVAREILRALDLPQGGETAQR